MTLSHEYSWMHHGALRVDDELVSYVILQAVAEHPTGVLVPDQVEVRNGVAELQVGGIRDP